MRSLINRFPLRVRLTLFVALAFAVTVVPASQIVLDRIEQRLVEGTAESAATILDDFLINTDIGIDQELVDEMRLPRVFFEDDAGRPASSDDFYETLIVEQQEIWPESVLLVEGLPVEFDVRPVMTIGEELSRTTDDGVSVAVTRAVAIGDRDFGVGVSVPLRSVEASMSAFRRVTWITLPLLVLVIAAITWITAGWALAPVDRITNRARQISVESLDDRLPVPPGQDEIGHLAQTLNEMLDRLEGSQTRQRQLVSDASHELRSPVGASRVQLEVALATADSADWVATAHSVLREQEALSDLIDDLFALFRLDESGLKSHRPVDLLALIGEESDRPRRLAPSISAHDGVNYDVIGDSGLLRKALRNLFDNAARHGQTTVAVSIERTAEEMVVHVDDDGPGVPKEQRRRIFERFTRLDEARSRDQGGGGLGLSIVDSVIGAHGGSVYCTDSPLGGARITMKLPA